MQDHLDRLAEAAAALVPIDPPPKPKTMKSAITKPARQTKEGKGRAGLRAVRPDEAV